MKKLSIRALADALCLIMSLTLAFAGVSENIFAGVDLSTPAPDPIERTDETYPSYAEYSLEEPSSEEIYDGGWILQVYNNVTEEDFSGFGTMLGEQGWNVKSQEYRDDGVWLTIVNGEREFYIFYSAETHRLKANYFPDSIIIDAKKAKYLEAKERYESGDYEGAYEIFDDLRGFNDVDWLLENDKNLDFNPVGDTIIFGSYEQDNNLANGTEPIEWIVLNIDDDGYYILLSKNGIIAKEYNERSEYTTWKDCTVRFWLNNEFYNSAFDNEEQSLIKTTHLVNTDENSFWKPIGGQDTEDKVYLLSIDEIIQYYGMEEQEYIIKIQDDKLCCNPTDYALASGAWTLEDNKDNKEYEKYDGNCRWWLRSAGMTQHEAAYVNYDGEVEDAGEDVHWNDNAIRPAIRIKYNQDRDIPADSNKETTISKDSSENRRDESWIDNDETNEMYEEMINDKIGEVIEFGQYPIDEYGHIRPIEWIVVDIDEDGYYILISKWGIDAKPFNNKKEDTSWKESSLRSWLNVEFYDSAFSSQEKEKIKTTHLINDDENYSGSLIENHTDDKVYLLSMEEAGRYLFDGDLEIKCAPSKYAIMQGAWTSNSHSVDGWATGYWWLWSIGYKRNRACFVNVDGEISGKGYNVSNLDGMVRPVIRILFD